MNCSSAPIADGVSGEGVKILVVGAGSAGRRHIQNLAQLGVEVSVFRYRRHLAEELRTEFGVPVHNSLEEAFDSSPDAVVIANRPDQHLQVACDAARRGIHLYIEKPLSHNLTRLRDLETMTSEKSLVVETGCMLRFDPNLKAIKNLLTESKIGQPYFIQLSVGQYLPSWRHGDYRESYSANVDQGGGVVLDLIHEFDYLIWWFGRVAEVSATLVKLSDLEISGEDVAEVTLKFKNGVLAQAHMDYLRPKYDRRCQIVGQSGSIDWVDDERRLTLHDIPGSIPKELGVTGYERNQLFSDQMANFLKSVQGNARPAVPLDDAIHAMHVAFAARESARSRTVGALA